ncbi:hypothetical protein GOARA_050_00700 [Gordonia araii NBRC 100433]|uniref:ESAT-6-like protein n=2 Tax=Gordonia araii TaxID=263909 RepID=G7H2D2_9ACTN|nr:hypothetical protein [Gordonia araii NBRC 100433]GAB10007.1 hypothetical protein GOARA_050_00700 [Gordonia araii NBRC 100433]
MAIVNDGAMTVDPTVLLAHAKEVRSRADQGREELASHRRNIEDAAASWGPSSRRAMSERVAEWASDTRTIVANLENYADMICDAGHRYAAQEEQNTGRMNSASSSVGRDRLNLA